MGVGVGGGGWGNAFLPYPPLRGKGPCDARWNKAPLRWTEDAGGTVSGFLRIRYAIERYRYALYLSISELLFPEISLCDETPPALLGDDETLGG